LIFGVLFVMLVYVAINFTYFVGFADRRNHQVHRFQNEIAAVAVVNIFWGAQEACHLHTHFFSPRSAHQPVRFCSRQGCIMQWPKRSLFLKGLLHSPNLQHPSKAIVFQGIWASGSCSPAVRSAHRYACLCFLYFLWRPTLVSFVLRVKMLVAHRPYKAWGIP